MLVVDDDPVTRRFVALVLGERGWRVLAAADTSAALAQAGIADLVLMDPRIREAGGLDAAAAMRAAGAQMPILAFTATPGLKREALLRRGFDGFLARPCSSAALRAAARRWRPAALPAATERLETVFGSERVRPLLAQLRDLLTESLGRVEDGAVAHRVAGAAGTLGFASLSAAWLALSEGHRAALGRTRRETRRAIGAIRRRLDG